MKKFFDKVADKAEAEFRGLQSNTGSSKKPPPVPSSTKPAPPIRPPPQGVQPPNPADVLRYRYHHGTNLGSIFVLEKWLHGSMFPGDVVPKGSSEHAAAMGWVHAKGVDAARQRFEEHWSKALTDQDADWLANQAHCTSIRLPIGYFTLGPQFCHNTPFAGVAGVYVNAWAAVKSIVARARAHGIGVLLDLHAVPGGANGSEHAGTNSGKAELWHNKAHLNLTRQCLEFIAQESKNMDGVIGIQFCNESEHGAEGKGMFEWYDAVAKSIAWIDPTMPLYVSDAWQLQHGVNFVRGENQLTSGVPNPMIVDTHLYWCFGQKDKARNPQDLIWNDVPKKLEFRDGAVCDAGAAQVVVGEYSVVLSEDSWNKRGDGNRDQLEKEFGQAQSRRYQQRAGGSFYWTYKMDWMDGGGWGFAQQTKSGNIFPPPNLTLSHDDIRSRVTHAQQQYDNRKQGACSGHAGYWDNTNPGKPFEHWRFDQGWTIGWSDALSFFEMRAKGGLPGPGGDKIGFLDVWVRRRLIESGSAESPLAWEFEQGIRQGIGGFYEAAGT